MSHVTVAAPIACTNAPLSAVDADLLVVPWFEGDSPRAVAGLDEATGGEIERALASKEFRGKLFDQFTTGITDRSWRVRRVALVGAGPIAGFDTDVARRLAAVAGLGARQRRAARLAFALQPGIANPSGDIDVRGLAQAVAEGLTMA
jgi:hypothetical protein